MVAFKAHNNASTLLVDNVTFRFCLFTAASVNVTAAEPDFELYSYEFWDLFASTPIGGYRILLT